MAYQASSNPTNKSPINIPQQDPLSNRLTALLHVFGVSEPAGTINPDHKLLTALRNGGIILDGWERHARDKSRHQQEPGARSPGPTLTVLDEP